jgi:xanthine/CO dehydrogenase XdhC/CoxF family maturation factor
MSEPVAPTVPPGHEDPTRPTLERQGRVVVVTYNHIADAIVMIADVVGRPTVVLDHRVPDDPQDVENAVSNDVMSEPATWLAEHPLGPDDALVFCDHDSPGTLDLLHNALSGDVGYVAMMGSRGRAESVFTMLQDEHLDADTLARLHIPAGLNVGGKAPGEIALSVVAEIVATAYGRDGGPMKSRTA